MKSLAQFIKESMTEPNAFVILKPGFEKYYEDWKRLITQKNGWDMIRCNKIKLTLDQAEDLYLPHKEKDFYSDLCEYMCSGDCYCAVCCKDCSDPIGEMNAVKESARKNWGIDDMRNCMHSSDSLFNVDRESKICLK